MKPDSQGGAGPHQNALLGCGAMLLSTIFFATMHACVRVLSDDGLHAYEIAFFRCFFGLLMLAPWIATRAGKALRTRHFGMHLTRAALNVVAMFMFFTALAITPIAQVQALSFTAPLFTSCERAMRRTPTMKSPTRQKAPTPNRKVVMAV